jgi:hypothetical protein
VYGCRKKRSNTGRFFDNHYKTATAEPFGTAADINRLLDGRFLFK